MDNENSEQMSTTKCIDFPDKLTDILMKICVHDRTVINDDNEYRGLCSEKQMAKHQNPYCFELPDIKIWNFNDYLEDVVQEKIIRKIAYPLFGAPQSKDKKTQKENSTKNTIKQPGLSSDTSDHNPSKDEEDGTIEVHGKNIKRVKSDIPSKSKAEKTKSLKSSKSTGDKPTHSSTLDRVKKSKRDKNKSSSQDHDEKSKSLNIKNSKNSKNKDVKKEEEDIKYTTQHQVFASPTEVSKENTSSKYKNLPYQFEQKKKSSALSLQKGHSDDHIESSKSSFNSFTKKIKRYFSDPKIAKTQTLPITQLFSDLNDTSKGSAFGRKSNLPEERKTQSLPRSITDKNWDIFDKTDGGKEKQRVTIKDLKQKNNLSLNKSGPTVNLRPGNKNSKTNDSKSVTLYDVQSNIERTIQNAKRASNRYSHSGIRRSKEIDDVDHDGIEKRTHNLLRISNTKTDWSNSETDFSDDLVEDVIRSKENKTENTSQALLELNFNIVESLEDKIQKSPSPNYFKNQSILDNARAQRKSKENEKGKSKSFIGEDFETYVDTRDKTHERSKETRINALENILRHNFQDKVKIIHQDIDEDIFSDFLPLVLKTYEESCINNVQNFAEVIKRCLDKTFDQLWHVVISKDEYQLYFSYENMLIFRYDQLTFIIWNSLDSCY